MSSPIIDSHCHAWTYWPYEPPVPDPESRGRVEQLLHEMDLNGVDQAFIVCAEIETTISLYPPCCGPGPKPSLPYPG